MVSAFVSPSPLVCSLLAAIVRTLVRVCMPLLFLCASIFAWLLLPTAAGCIATYMLTRYALRGHPLGMRELHVTPTLAYNPWRLRVRVRADGFFFGNPPRHPRADFVAARIIVIEAAVAPLAIWRWLIGARVPHPLAASPDHMAYGVFEVESIDATGVVVDFSMSGGEFNVNGV